MYCSDNYNRFNSTNNIICFSRFINTHIIPNINSIGNYLYKAVLVTIAKDNNEVRAITLVKHISDTQFSILYIDNYAVSQKC